MDRMKSSTPAFRPAIHESYDTPSLLNIAIALGNVSFTHAETFAARSGAVSISPDIWSTATEPPYHAATTIGTRTDVSMAATASVGFFTTFSHHA